MEKLTNYIKESLTGKVNFSYLGSKQKNMKDKIEIYDENGDHYFGFPYVDNKFIAIPLVFENDLKSGIVTMVAFFEKHDMDNYLNNDGEGFTDTFTFAPQGIMDYLNDGTTATLSEILGIISKLKEGSKYELENYLSNIIGLDDAEDNVVEEFEDVFDDTITDKDDFTF